MVALEWNNGKVYFFSNAEYTRYDIATDRADSGYPKSISGNWPGLWERDIDAAINWGNGKAYFFRKNEYIRYDIAADQADPGYPKKMTVNSVGNWPGLWERDIDAAINWGNGKAYFFRKNEYIRYDIAADQTDLGYPKKMTVNSVGNWPGLWERDIDSAINWGNGKAYFFKNNRYARYDIAADRTDSGYPNPIVGNWSGLISILSIDDLIEYGLLTSKALEIIVEQVIGAPYEEELKKQAKLAERDLRKLREKMDKLRDESNDRLNNTINEQERKKREKKQKEIEEQKAKELGKVIITLIKIKFEAERRKIEREEEQTNHVSASERQNNDNNRRGQLDQDIRDSREKRREAERFDNWERFNRTA